MFPLSFVSLRAAALVPFVMLLTSCAAPQRPIVEKTGFVPYAQMQLSGQFETVTLTRENFGATAKRCMPSWTERSTTAVLGNWKLPLPRGTTVIHGHERDAGYLVVTGSTAVCIAQSEGKHPILAGEAFYKTINPSGVPPDVSEGWYLQIAAAIARTGTASVIYKFSNGNAQLSKYWIEPASSSPSSLSYWTEFKRAGEWSAAPSDIVLSHPALASVSSIKYGSQFSKPFLSHRFN